MKLLQSRWLAVGWFIFMCLLFFLPGSSLPKESSWMKLISFDKWIHAGLFAVLIFLWNASFSTGSRYFEFFLFLLSVIYGFCVEFIQRAWVPNRSFDLLDVAADTVGSVIGLIVWLSVYKNINPCRNRGRNQN